MLPRWARVDLGAMAMKVCSPSDCLVSYLGHLLGGGSYLSAEKQSVYSTTPADRPPSELALWKMQTTLFSIWTRIAKSTSYDHNHYAISNLMSYKMRNFQLQYDFDLYVIFLIYFWFLILSTLSGEIAAFKCINFI